MKTVSDKALAELSQDIRQWGLDLGFEAVGISPGELSGAAVELQNWLQKGWHGEMDFMSTHVPERTHPELLVPDTCRIISVRLGYWHDFDGCTTKPFGIQKKRISPGMRWGGTITARCDAGCRS